jgi:hypothetical protein
MKNFKSFHYVFILCLVLVSGIVFWAAKSNSFAAKEEGGSNRPAKVFCDPNPSPSGPDTVSWTCEKIPLVSGWRKKNPRCSNEGRLTGPKRRFVVSGTMKTSEASSSDQMICDLFGQIFPSFSSTTVFKKLPKIKWNDNFGEMGRSTSTQLMRFCDDPADTSTCYEEEKIVKIGKPGWGASDGFSGEYSDETDVYTWKYQVLKNNYWYLLFNFTDNNENLYSVYGSGIWTYSGYSTALTTSTVPVIDLIINGKLQGPGGTLPLTSGDKATLTWTSGGVTSCAATSTKPTNIISGALAWKGIVPKNNNSAKYSYKINSDTTFGIKCCNGANECRNDEAAVKISSSTVLIGTSTPPKTIPVQCNFAANPSTIFPYQKSTLSWQCQGAKYCSIDQGIGSVNNISGAKDIRPLKKTTYTLSCNNPNDSKTYQEDINVGIPWGKEINP